MHNVIFNGPDLESFDSSKSLRVNIHSLVDISLYNHTYYSLIEAYTLSTENTPCTLALREAKETFGNKVDEAVLLLRVFQGKYIPTNNQIDYGIIRRHAQVVRNIAEFVGAVSIDRPAISAYFKSQLLTALNISRPQCSNYNVADVVGLLGSQDIFSVVDKVSKMMPLLTKSLWYPGCYLDGQSKLKIKRLAAPFTRMVHHNHRSQLITVGAHGSNFSAATAGSARSVNTTIKKLFTHSLVGSISSSSTNEVPIEALTKVFEVPGDFDHFKVNYKPVEYYISQYYQEKYTNIFYKTLRESLQSIRTYTDKLIYFNRVLTQKNHPYCQDLLTTKKHVHSAVIELITAVKTSTLEKDCLDQHVKHYNQFLDSYTRARQNNLKFIEKYNYGHELLSIWSNSFPPGHKGLGQFIQTVNSDPWFKHFNSLLTRGYELTNPFMLVTLDQRHEGAVTMAYNLHFIYRTVLWLLYCDQRMNKYIMKFRAR